MAEALRVGIIANPAKDGAKELLLDLIGKFEGFEGSGGQAGRPEVRYAPLLAAGGGGF